MDTTSTIILFGVLILFGAVVFMALQSVRKDNAGKRQMAEQLGFTPITADAALTGKIGDLYQREKTQYRYELRQVYHRKQAEAEFYLFDLIDTADSEESWTERQAVAVISPRLKLPHFVLYPRVDQNNWLAGLANNMLEWAVAKVGQPVEFPGNPAFQQRYMVNSTEPESTKRFFNETLLDQLAQTRLYAIRARGDIFTFSEIDPQVRSITPQILSQRVERATTMLGFFQKQA